MRKPNVKVVADGSNGYIVRFWPVVGPPADVRRFPIDSQPDVPADIRKLGTMARRAQADSFADGVRLGLLLSVNVLEEVVSA